MSDLTIYLDMFIAACGVYLIYGAVIMKVKGEITANIMLPKNVNPANIKDKEGFIKAVFLKLLILGIVTVIVGFIILLNDLYTQNVILGAVSYGVFAAALLVYGFALKKAHKMYL